MLETSFLHINYYPFGSTQEGLGFVSTTLYGNGLENKHLFGGQEKDKKTGFYEYHFRQYDSWLGRWHVVDPSAESYALFSPYHFAGNNPVNNFEVDGADMNCIADAWEAFLADDNGSSGGGGGAFAPVNSPLEVGVKAYNPYFTYPIRSTPWGGYSTPGNGVGIRNGWMPRDMAGGGTAHDMRNDYFSKDGTYQGSHGSGNQVMILQGNPDDYNNSIPFSENSLRGTAIQKIVAHYHPGVEPGDIFPTRQSPTEMAAGFTSEFSGNPKTGYSYSRTRPYFLVESYKGSVSSLLDDKNNLENVLVHEKHHFDSDFYYENGRYIGRPTDLNNGGDDRALIRHLFGAYLTQITHESYVNTTSELKRKTNQAIKYYTLSISHIPLRAAVMRYFKTKFNFNFNKSYERF